MGDPQRALTGSLAIAAGVLLFLAAYPFSSSLRARRSAARDVRAMELGGRIRQFDEVLTMSARMGAVTGDRSWETRYRRFEPELDAVIKEFQSLSETRAQRDFSRETDAANLALVGLEHKSFELVRQGRSGEASRLLFGKEYLDQKDAYSDGLEKFLAASDKHRAAEWRRARAFALLATAGSLAVTIGLFVIWAKTMPLLAEARASHRKAVLYSNLEHTVTAILAEPGNPLEAAPRVIEAVCSVLGWDFGAWWLVDRDRGELYCSSHWHAAGVDVAPFAELTARTRFKPGIGLPGRVWRSGQAAWIVDVTKDANFPRAPTAAGVGLHGACACHVPGIRTPCGPT